jgi:hypothetical protein
MRVSSKRQRLIRPEATRLDGNVPIAMMPNGLTDAAMAAVSNPMPWFPSIEDFVLVSVLFVIMNWL